MRSSHNLKKPSLWFWSLQSKSADLSKQWGRFFQILCVSQKVQTLPAKHNKIFLKTLWKFKLFWFSWWAKNLTLTHQQPTKILWIMFYEILNKLSIKIKADNSTKCAQILPSSLKKRQVLDVSRLLLLCLEKKLTCSEHPGLWRIFGITHIISKSAFISSRHNGIL